MYGFKRKDFCSFTAFSPLKLKKKNIPQAFLQVEAKLTFYLWENFAELY